VRGTTGQSKQEQLAGSIPYHLGSGVTHPIALEGALKLKEITRPAAHCEGIRNPVSSSEFKHGPLSAVRQGYPVLFITALGDDATMINPVLRNRNEVTTRGGRAVAIAAEHPALRANVHDYLVIPAQLTPVPDPQRGERDLLPHERRPDSAESHRSRPPAKPEQDVDGGLTLHVVVRFPAKQQLAAFHDPIVAIYRDAFKALPYSRIDTFDVPGLSRPYRVMGLELGNTPTEHLSPA